MEPILEVRDLTKIFSGQEQDFAALKGVSFCLYPGETLGIVGESGSGKSTLARVIGLRRPDSAGGNGLVQGQGKRASGSLPEAPDGLSVSRRLL